MRDPVWTGTETLTGMETQPMNASEPRTLVFSFDGTGNEPHDATGFKEDESVSNVLKLHVLMGGGLEEDRSETRTDGGERQETRYYNGIGTREEGETIPLVGRLVSRMQKAINSALAPSWGDARRILNQAAEDLDELSPTRDDRIVVFGFSRGAALARKFAGRTLEADPDLHIAFLGVFDTVAAMDGVHTKGEEISSDVVFENGTLDPRVRRAVHIVSLDEDRIAFEPTLINRDEENPGRITEIWFPGVHGDVGGGYWHDGLADVSLRFMIEKCREALGEDISIAESTTAEIGRLLSEQGEILKLLDVDDILVHPNVTGMVHRHTTGSGRLYTKDVRKVCVREDDRPLSTEECRPLVHHSVKARFDLVAEYRPPALRAVRFDLLLPDGARRPISGISGLREHVDDRERAQKLSG